MADLPTGGAGIAKEEEEDLSSPDATACDEATKQFAAITETDEACGHFFLQDYNWNLERALNAFYQASGAAGESDGDAGEGERSAESSTGRGNDSSEDDRPPLSELKVISWNVDGLDNKNFNTRMRAVCTVIIKEKPQMVFLQEVVEEGYRIMENYLSDDYLLVSGKNMHSLIPYFTLMLLRRKEVSCRKQTVKPFPTTMMGRTLLMVEGVVGDCELLLMTAHLESTKESERERKKQLQMAFQACSDAPKNVTVIFGGDLNARDKEIDDVGGIPGGMWDSWKTCGSKKFTEFTWDMVKNDNLQWEKKFKPRCRFDRLYVSREGAFQPADFMLVGMERIQNCHCFPSDHFGIMTTLKK